MRLIPALTFIMGTFPIYSISSNFYYGNFSNLQYISGLVQDCGNSIANALELPQSSTQPSISSNSMYDK